MVYTPWSRRFPHEGKPNDVLVKLFEEFLRSQQCPPSLKYAYLKARDTYLYDLKKPVNICQPLSTNLNEAMRIDDQAYDIAALTMPFFLVILIVLSFLFNIDIMSVKIMIGLRRHIR